MINSASCCSVSTTDGGQFLFECVSTSLKRTDSQFWHRGGRLKNDSLGHFARYRDLLVWSPEVDDDDQYEDQHKAIEESLVADFSVHYPPSSQEDVAWFRNALEHEQREFFAAFVFQKSRGVPEVLYETMIRAAVYERDPSKNRAFVEPYVATFGLRRVSETLLERFENGSDQEKAGVVQAMYHAGLIGVRDSYWRRPDSDAVFKLVGDLWMRQRCLLLREFVSNPSVLVRQRIIPHLDLTNVSSYPEEFKPLVPQAIQIARNHTDGYIRHRVEIQMGSNETQLFSPLPAMDRSDTEDLPEGGTQESIGRATRSMIPRLKSFITRLRRWGP